MEVAAIRSLRREWAVRSRSSSAARVLRALVEAEPDLAALGAGDLGDLFTAMGAQPADGVPRGWDVAAALIRQVKLDELVGLGLLAALAPGLVRVGRELDWGRGGPWGDAEAFAWELIATTWSVLADMACGPPEYPLRRVLSRTRDRLREQRRAARRRAERSLPAVPLVCDPRDEHGAPVIEELARALRENRAISRDDRRIVFCHHVLGYSLAEIAAQCGDTLNAISYRSRRTEALLCAS